MGCGRAREHWLMAPPCPTTLQAWGLAWHLKQCQQPPGTALSPLTLHEADSPWSSASLRSKHRDDTASPGSFTLSATAPFCPRFIERLRSPLRLRSLLSQGNLVSLDLLCHVSCSRDSVELYSGMEGTQQQSSRMEGAIFRSHLWLDVKGYQVTAVFNLFSQAPAPASHSRTVRQQTSVHCYSWLPPGQSSTYTTHTRVDSLGFLKIHLDLEHASSSSANICQVWSHAYGSQPSPGTASAEHLPALSTGQFFTLVQNATGVHRSTWGSSSVWKLSSTQIGHIL